MYKKQTTLAQYKVIQQDLRDQYFEEKAQQVIAKHDISNKIKRA